MTPLQPERITGPNNELAKERNRAAAERTMTAWIQNCLTLIGFGIAVDQINQALDARSAATLVATGPSVAPLIAIGFVGFGMALLVMAWLQYRLEIRSIERADYVLLSVSQLNQIVGWAIVLFGVLSGIALIIFARG
ncbi:MAG: YidH family protein [Leptolyngbyaceae cyanobacterium]